MDIDYKGIGFKSGLEIHQQLDSHKLFCNCPSILRNDEPDYTIKRKLHAIAGESGEVDIAAKYQASFDNEFIYQGYNDTTCLVELDEEPPHAINSEALKIALQISLLLNAKIIPITQIMRKTVIDGSNTSGFQRTMMIARDGYVETPNGKVGIDAIFLEEDAARAVSREKGQVVWRLDRLGFPMIEIATAPDIKSPEQAKEVALHIGSILRSCKVKRGIGTIRQDVNMSIKGGERVEIKGMQDMKIFIDVINNEIERQIKLVKEGKSKSEVRNALDDGTTEFLRPMPGSARMYPETDLPLLKIHKDMVDDVKRNLPKLISEEKEELKKKGLNDEMIRLLFKQDKISEFKELLKVMNNPVLIAKLLLMYPQEIAKREGISNEKSEEILNLDVFEFIIDSLKKKKISENEIKNVLERIVKGEELEKAIKFEKADLNAIEKRVMEIIKEKPGLNPNAYMGLVMSKFKGKISGKEVMEMIGKYLK